MFTVTRSGGPQNIPLTVNYAFTSPVRTSFYDVLPRMAQNGADFSTTPGTVTIPAGATTADIVIHPTYDRIFEGDETVEITLVPAAVAWPDPAGYVIDNGLTATGIIHDAPVPANTSFVWLFVSDPLATHSAWPGREGSFTVRRSGDLSQAITVPYSIDGSATNGVDYVPLPGFVTIPAGAASVIILVNPYAGSVGSLFWNPVETVVITLLPSPADNPQVPYFLGTTANQPLIGGISILDHLDLSPKQRALLIRRRQLVIPIPPVRPPVPPPPGLAAAAVVAAPDVFAVEASADLVNWEFIGTTDPTGQGGDFVDVNAGDYAQRFYRFRLLPPAAP